MFSVTFISKGIEDKLVPKVNISDLRKLVKLYFFKRFSIGFAIRIAVDRNLLEIHDVHSKGSCFIRENVLDLSEFLIKVRRLDNCGGFYSLPLLILAAVHHKVVDIDLDSLNKLDHLQRDK